MSFKNIIYYHRGFFSGSIFFPLIVAPLKEVVSSTLIFDNTDTNMLMVYVYLLRIVQLNSKLYFLVMYFGHF